jgi:hypothetical protein
LRSSADGAGATLDGTTGVELASMLHLPRVELHASVSSTLDVAHSIAADAPSGTLVLADEQTSGRGRHGRRWTSPPGAGLWLTMIERPTDARALDVLALADALDRLAAVSPRLGAVVEYRFFAGLSFEEVAEATGTSVATVKRDWTRARAWLYRAMHDDGAAPALAPALAPAAAPAASAA